MKILTRYVIRAHMGPFLFAFVTVTGLLFLNAVAARLEKLAGRGLEWSVIGEFMLLSLPHVIALTFPMSILIAVLYACSDMTEHNEIAAMSGGGIHPARIMTPLIAIGVLFSGLMFYFNDKVLPASNHELSTLITEVGSMNPTLNLREEVINPIQTGDQTEYFLRARSIDPATNYLQDIDIYDLSLPNETRTIQAKEGEMAFSPDGKDLYLTLHEGTVYLVSDTQPGDFQHMKFTTQILPMRGVVTEMQEAEETGVRSDREMDIAMLQGEIDILESELAVLEEQSYEISRTMVMKSLGSAFPGWGTPVDAPEVVGPEASPEGIVQLPLPEYLPSRDDVVESAAVQYRTADIRWGITMNQIAGHQVEIYKKHAIAFACLIFVLLAPPLALRFPRGGVGMVIAVSLGIFFLYWMGLIGGERLADRGKMAPIAAMWAPNLLLLVPALLLLSRMARQMSSNRGGTWDEVTFRIRTLFGSSPKPAPSRSGGGE